MAILTTLCCCNAMSGGKPLRIFLLLGQSNMEGQAYTYDSPETAGWNVPTMEFLVSGTAAATNYRANMPFGFEPDLNAAWLDPRTDVWAVHYDSGNGNARDVQVTDNPPVTFNGIGPLSPGFGVGINNGSMIGAELAMGIHLGLIIGESSDQNATLNVSRSNAVAELNGEIPNSAVLFDTAQMKGTDWGNNDLGVPFSQGWGYHFHARAENFLEIGWKAAGAVLDNGFLSPSPLWFDVPVFSNVSPTQATAIVHLGTNANEVIVVWDSSDQGTGATTDWTNQRSLGSDSAGQVQGILPGLSEGSDYVVRFYANNTSLAAVAWSPSVSFTTPWQNPPPLLDTPEVSSVTSEGATLACQLLQATADVGLVWAYTDQGSSGIAVWTNAPGGGSHAFGTAAATATVTHRLKGLTAATTYVFRFHATNLFGGVWTAADGFGTLSAGSGSGADSLVAYWSFDDYNETGDFNAEDFTLSFWEKSQFRDVAGGGWGAGRGRSQWFTKAPYISTAGVVDGFGLNLTQNHFDLMSNNNDNYGQTSLGARYTYPSGSSADDSGVWAHWAVVGVYNAVTNQYAITIYLNGTAVDWNGAVGSTVTVTNDIIDNPGDLTIGGFFRNNGWSPQRFISFNQKDGVTQTIGKGWMDDFAIWEAALDKSDIADLASGTKGPLDISPPKIAGGMLIYVK